MKKHKRWGAGVYLRMGALAAVCLIIPLWAGCAPRKPPAIQDAAGGADENTALSAQDATPVTAGAQAGDPELWQDLFVSACMPAILEAVEDAYGMALMVDPWAVNILRVSRADGYRSFCFVIEAEITPYDGPHNILGRDRITIESDGTGWIEITSLRHVEGFAADDGRAA